MMVSPLKQSGPLVRKHGVLNRWFPTPDMLALGGAGVDISDSSIKWISFVSAEHGWEVGAHAQITLEKGIVEGGVVQDEGRLGEAIRSLREQVGGSLFVHAALPEELAYVFSMHVPDIRDRTQVLNVIEFELEGRVPLTAEKTVFDYDISHMHADGEGAEIGVTVFPADVVAGYTNAFTHAGVTLLSLEIEARSIARAILPRDARETVLVADFGRARTGFAIIKNGIPIFTSTVAVGGDAMTRVIVEKLNVSEEEADVFKNEHGIARSGDASVRSAMLETAQSLANEIQRHYQYWDMRRNEEGERITPVARILLLGGSSNLKGLDEFIAGQIHAPVEYANAWTNVCDFNHYIPPIDSHYALGYATAVGLSLRSAH